MRSTSLLAGTLLAAGLAATPVAAHAQSVQFVPCTGSNGGAAGLAAAISNVGTGSGVIELAENCTYSFTDPFGRETALPAIDGQIAITGHHSTIARAANATSSFAIASVSPNASLALLEVTIKGGNMGGIANSGTLSLKYSKVVKNRSSSSGGGIFGSSGSLTLLDHTVVCNNHTGTGIGGGIAIDNGTLRAFNSGIFDNTAGDSGGGLANSAGAVKLIDTLITNNRTALNGGGVFNREGGTLQIKDSQIVENQAVNDGGGVYNSTNSTAEIEDSYITRNRASGTGGGIFNDGAISVRRTLIVDNQPNNCAGGNPVPGC